LVERRQEEVAAAAPKSPARDSVFGAHTFSPPVLIIIAFPRVKPRCSHRHKNDIKLKIEYDKKGEPELLAEARQGS
jgi:hypothetical protein